MLVLVAAVCRRYWSCRTFPSDTLPRPAPPRPAARPREHYDIWLCSNRYPSKSTFSARPSAKSGGGGGRGGSGGRGRGGVNGDIGSGGDGAGSGMFKDGGRGGNDEGGGSQQGGGGGGVSRTGSVSSAEENARIQVCCFGRGGSFLLRAGIRELRGSVRRIYYVGTGSSILLRGPPFNTVSTPRYRA